MGERTGKNFTYPYSCPERQSNTRWPSGYHRAGLTRRRAARWPRRGQGTHRTRCWRRFGTPLVQFDGGRQTAAHRGHRMRRWRSGHGRPVACGRGRWLAHCTVYPGWRKLMEPCPSPRAVDAGTTGGRRVSVLTGKTPPAIYIGAGMLVTTHRMIRCEVMMWSNCRGCLTGNLLGI